jgi:hypothetical protein
MESAKEIRTHLASQPRLGGRGRITRKQHRYLTEGRQSLEGSSVAPEVLKVGVCHSGLARTCH